MTLWSSRIPVCMLLFCITDHTKVVLKISLKKMCHATQQCVQHSVHMDVVDDRREKVDLPVDFLKGRSISFVFTLLLILNKVVVVFFSLYFLTDMSK